MRTVELRRIRTDGVKLVLVSGKHVDCHVLERFPELDAVRAMLFHVPWRKQHQAKDVWVPLVCQGDGAGVRTVWRGPEARRSGFLVSIQTEIWIGRHEPGKPDQQAKFPKRFATGIDESLWVFGSGCEVIHGACIACGWLELYAAARTQ